jgi:hypothetical protein
MREGKGMRGEESAASLGHLQIYKYLPN